MPPSVVFLYAVGTLFSFFSVRSFSVVSLLLKAKIMCSLNFFSHFFHFFSR